MAHRNHAGLHHVPNERQESENQQAPRHFSLGLVDWRFSLLGADLLSISTKDRQQSFEIS